MKTVVKNWLEAAQKGDRGAYALVVDHYRIRVFRWLWAMTGDFQGAEDLAQEAFFKAWTALPALQDLDRFRAWLFRIVRNCHVDSRRRQKHADNAGRESEPYKPGPLTLLVLKEKRQLFEKACARLPEPIRAAFLLWAQGDCSHAQIGQILGITEETARWRVFKARKCLAAALKTKLPKSGLAKV